ncbi:hypothetical protein Aph01nite_63070 [Acrocarpospora phusangensis]|uniref:Uncharacterized protein n=1 Tax=Acrocarpospora phusangensis TaxID=1070424 RepID=A0A919QFI3_9ACTN|nr:hypothetical protein Aph01nite_63070 [Acrocarpospora phusangensis]
MLLPQMGTPPPANQALPAIRSGAPAAASAGPPSRPRHIPAVIPAVIVFRKVRPSVTNAMRKPADKAEEWLL